MKHKGITKHSKLLYFQKLLGHCEGFVSFMV